jgi:ribosomal protein L36
MQIFRIPSINMPLLEEKIQKLNKKAKKLGCQPIVLKVVSIITEKRKDSDSGLEYDYLIHECTVEGESPKLMGWTLVAAIEPLETQDAQENLIREVPGEVCPEHYRTTDMRCDHCQEVRKRSSVYVLKHDTLGHKQVGRNCIADFLGHESPTSMLAKAEWLMSLSGLLKEASDEEYSGGSSCPAVSIHHFVSIVSAVIKKLGWVSRANSDESNPSTATIAFDICYRPNSYTRELIEKYNLVATQDDFDAATKALEWASKLDPVNAKSNYLHDLGVCCRATYVIPKTSGFVASVISAHNRHLANQVAVSNNVSKHVGTVGERTVFEKLTVKCATPCLSGVYPKTAVRFIDQNGNVIVWFASGSPEWVKIGETVSVKCSVSSHTSFNDIPETIVKRVTPVN